VSSFLRTIVIGDLHLVRDTPAGVVSDFLRLLREHAGARVVVAGDLFDLSADHPGEEKGPALRDALAAQPAIKRALQEHVERGGRLDLIGGNHDAALGDPDELAPLAKALELSTEDAKRMRSTPWFFREGGLHLEHGHLYDPDNALTHPLVVGVRSLGVHFTEEFIAPTGAFRYLNSNDRPPLELLLSAFKWYGVRGPYVVFKYFDAAFRAVLKSGPFFEGHGEALVGAAREADFMQKHGVDSEGRVLFDETLVNQMLALAARPTMQDAAATLSRLYLDRVAATCSILAGSALLAAGKHRAGAWAIGAGALAMSISWAAGHDRYGGSVPERLAESAGKIAATTGAKLVVMGHAHRETDAPFYANTGSFSFPQRAPGRPFLEIEGTADAPRAVRRYITPSG
jgi:UDP-2,3-diacylglucosamine pyrophosphatase LpxH